MGTGRDTAFVVARDVLDAGARARRTDRSDYRRRMIRHRPFGPGHPYRLGPDQRGPPIPIADAPFEGRATTGNDVRSVDGEVKLDGQSVAIPARRTGSAEG